MTRDPESNSAMTMIATTIIVIALLVRLVVALSTPPFASPDEFPHYWVAAEIAQSGGLPTSRPEWPAYEAFQPPLYYLLAGTVLAGGKGAGIPIVAESDPETILAITELPPSLLLLRLLSVAIAAGTLLLLRRLLDKLPLSRIVRLSTLAFVAFLPTFIGTTATVNNDGLTVLFATTALLYLLPQSGRPRHLVLGGLFVGLALLTKLSAVVLLPLLALLILLPATAHPITIRLRNLALLIVGILPGLLLLVTRNLATYGTITATMPGVERVWSFEGANIFRALRNLFWSFWFAFGRTYEIQLPPLLYLLLFLPLTLLPLAGLARMRRLSTSNDSTVSPGIMLLGLVAAIGISLLFTLAYPEATMTSWGKNLYPLLPVIGILFALGSDGDTVGQLRSRRA